MGRVGGVNDLNNAPNKRLRLTRATRPLMRVE
jgi:hypothetical protein